MEEKILFLLLINLTLSLSYSFLKDKQIYTGVKLKPRIWYGKEESNKIPYKTSENIQYTNNFDDIADNIYEEVEERRKREVKDTEERVLTRKKRSLFSDITEIPRSRNITIVNPSRIEIFRLYPFETSNYNENITHDNSMEVDKNVTKEIEYGPAPKPDNAEPSLEIVPSVLQSIVVDDNITDRNEIIEDIITDQNMNGKPIKIITSKIQQIKQREQTKQPDAKSESTSKSNYVSESKFLKIISVLAATFKKIITQHEHIKKMHRDVIFASKELMSKRTEVLKKLAEFDKKHKRLISQGSHLAALQYTLANKQEMFLKKESDFLNKRREFEDLKKQFASQQRQFHKLQKIVLDMKVNNRTVNHSPVMKSSNNSKVVKNENIETTEKSSSSLETSASKAVNKVVEMISKHKSKNYYRDMLDQKDYIDIDDIVRKFYFNDTSKDKVRTKTKTCNCSKNNKKSKNNIMPGKLYSKPQEEKIRELSKLTLNTLKASDDKYPVTKMLNEKEINPKIYQTVAVLEPVNITVETNKRNGISSILGSDLKEHERIVLQSILKRDRRSIDPAITEVVAYKLEETTENTSLDVPEKVKDDKNDSDIMDVLYSKVLNISNQTHDHNFTTVTDFDIAEVEKVFNVIEELARESDKLKKNDAMKNLIITEDAETQTTQPNIVKNIKTTTSNMHESENSNSDNKTVINENEETLNNRTATREIINDNRSLYQHVPFIASTSDVEVITAHSIGNYEIMSVETTEHEFENHVVDNLNNVNKSQSETIYMSKNIANVVDVRERNKSEKVNHQNNIDDEVYFNKAYIENNNKNLQNKIFENDKSKNEDIIFNTDQNIYLQNNEMQEFEKESPLVTSATDVMEINNAVALLEKQILDKAKAETENLINLNEYQNLNQQAPMVNSNVKNINYNDNEQEFLQKIGIINGNQTRNLIHAINTSVSLQIENTTIENDDEFIYQNDTAFDSTIDAIDFNIITESQLLDNEEELQSIINQNDSYNHQELVHDPKINMDVEIKSNCSDDTDSETEIDDQNNFTEKPIIVVESKNYENGVKHIIESESDEDINVEIRNLKTHVITKEQPIESKSETVYNEHVYTGVAEINAHEKRSTAELENEPILSVNGTEASDKNNDEETESRVSRIWKEIVKIIKKIFHKAKGFFKWAWKGNDKDRNSEYIVKVA